MINRRAVITIIIFVIVCVTIGLFTWFLISKNSDSNTITDRDTGETYVKTGTLGRTGADTEYRGPLVLFGIEPFVKNIRSSKNSDTGNIISGLKDAMYTYNTNRLHDKFASLTLRPQQLTLTDSKLTGTIRLGQTDEVIPFSADMSPNRKGIIITINKDGSSYGGQFIYIVGLNNKENLLFTISQKNDTSTDLIVKTYPGYRTVALRYLEDELNLYPSDFAITFTISENPFQ